MITVAAIRHDGVIYIGARHDICYLSAAVQLNGKMPAESEAGFLTHAGEFLDRKEAARHAFECGQLHVYSDSLMSEDLW